MGFSQQLALANRLQVAQNELAIGVASDVARIFPSLDVNNVDQSFGAYSQQLIGLTQVRRQVASNLGRAYFMSTRLDAGVTDDFIADVAPPVPNQQIFGSLLATGPLLIKKGLGSGRTAQEVRAIAQTATTGALTRHVLNGSRDTVKHLVYRDARCNGWARVASGLSCSFCAMLVSRGAVYKNQRIAERGVDGDPYHDHCRCYAVALFGTGRYPGDEQAAEMQELWYASTGDVSGDGKRLSFFKAYKDEYGAVASTTARKSAAAQAAASRSLAKGSAKARTVTVTQAERGAASKYRMEVTKDGLVYVNDQNDTIQLDKAWSGDERKRIVAAMEKGQGHLPTRTSIVNRDVRGLFAKDAATEAYNTAQWDNKIKAWKSNNTIVFSVDRLRKSKAKDGQFMPVRTKDNDLEYTVLHELGHSAERRFGFNGGVDGIITENYLDFMPANIKATLSRYGRSSAQEAWAEAWAEFFMTNGQTTNLAAQWFAQRYEWSNLL